MPCGRLFAGAGRAPLQLRMHGQRLHITDIHGVQQLPLVVHPQRFERQLRQRPVRADDQPPGHRPLRLQRSDQQRMKLAAHRLDVRHRLRAGGRRVIHRVAAVGTAPDRHAAQLQRGAGLRRRQGAAGAQQVAVEPDGIGLRGRDRDPGVAQAGRTASIIGVGDHGGGRSRPAPAASSGRPRRGRCCPPRRRARAGFSTPAARWH